MKRWMVILALMVCGVRPVCGTAQDTPGSPPTVELEVRLIERPQTQDGGATTVGGVMTPAETKTLIAELAANPKVKVLAAPRLRTEAGQKASVRSGGEVPRQTLKSEPGDIPTVKYDSFGIALDATVSVSPSGSLVVDLLCEQSERDVTGKPETSVNRRRIETRVDLRNGQTILLSGDRVVAPGKPQAGRRRKSPPVELVVLVTATLVDEPGK